MRQGHDSMKNTHPPDAAQCHRLQAAFHGALSFRSVPRVSQVVPRGRAVSVACILAHAGAPRSDGRRKCRDFPRILFSHAVSHASPNNCRFCIAGRLLVQ